MNSNEKHFCFVLSLCPFTIISLLIIIILLSTFFFFNSYTHTKLFDRINSQVMSPSHAPPGDAINRCRDAVDAIQSATSHKYSRDRAELIHLLGSPHIQVSAFINYYSTSLHVWLFRLYFIHKRFSLFHDALSQTVYFVFTNVHAATLSEMKILTLIVK